MQQIPKIIHYCWFGGKPKPKLVEQCIASWKKYCPDYEIREWNENNYDVSSCAFAREAYEAKKWAFVADYARIDVLYRYGGIYLDTDMELLRLIDEFLEEEAFLGFECKDSPAAGIIGCIAKQTFIGQLLEYYHDRHFVCGDSCATTPSPLIMASLFQDNGAILNGKKQTICGCTIYPEQFFYPNGLLEIAKRHPKTAYSFHHYCASWYAGGGIWNRNLPQRIKMYLVHKGRNLIGTSGMFALSRGMKGRKP